MCVKSASLWVIFLPRDDVGLTHYFAFHVDNVRSYHSIRAGVWNLYLCHATLAIVAFQHTNNKYLHVQQVVWWHSVNLELSKLLREKKSAEIIDLCYCDRQKMLLKFCIWVSQVGALSYCIVFLVINKSKRGANPWGHQRVSFLI
mgnify:CR=1 FL=1